MTLPNFIIAGAARSGTTTIFRYLRRHPDVFMPGWKEPNFFIDEPGSISTFEEYARLFSAVSSEKAIGEASTAYLYFPDTPGKIMSVLGGIKIIIVLRNPVDMAYSLWGFMVREGNEPLPFRDAIDVEESRLNNDGARKKLKGWIYNYAYIDRAKYARQVERYLSVFGLERVKIFIYEDFFSDPSFHFSDLCRFLDVDPQNISEFSVHNPAGTVRSKLLEGFLFQNSMFKKIARATVPRRTLIALKPAYQNMKKLNRTNSSLPPLSRSDRTYLIDLFQEDVHDLERILNRSLEGIWY